MITMKKLGVVKEVPSEEDAAKLARQGFERVGGAADPVSDRPATMGDLAMAMQGLYERLKADLLAELSTEKPKAARNSKKEGKDGGTDQPDSADGAK